VLIIYAKIRQLGGNTSHYPRAWTVVEFALLISHGQASVGKGFSINKEMIVENQEVASLMAIRLIKDHVMSVNGVTNVNVAISREMVLAARCSRAKYMDFSGTENRTKRRVQEN